MAIKVFVDANIFKYSATKLLRFIPREQKLNWGGQEIITTVHDMSYINPNENIKNNDTLRKEVDLLPYIVELQEKENIEFCVTFESDLEVMGLPNMDSRTGKLYGAKITYLKPPVDYQRILIGWMTDTQQAQYNFLRNIKSKRFLEIQRATGAYQGKNPPNRNQLLDAFHLWCAEHSKCDVFLTGEATKLKQSINRKKGFEFEPELMLPSELLNLLDGGFAKKSVRQIKRWFNRKEHM